MNLLDASRQALAELERLHDVIEPCDNPKCPARKSIADLKRAIDYEEEIKAAMKELDDKIQRSFDGP